MKKTLTIIGLMAFTSIGAIPIPQQGQWVSSTSHYNETTGEVWYQSEFIIDNQLDVELISAKDYTELGKKDAKKATPKSKRIIELLTPKAEAVIAINATTTSTISNSVTSKTFSHTIAGTETLLLVCAGGRDSTGTDDFYVSSATYNSVEMIKEIEAKDATDRVASTWMSLVNPTTGANNVVVNFNGSNQTAYAGAISFTGADQTVPTEGIASSSASSNNPNVSVTTTSSNTIVTDCGTFDSAAATLTSSQTQQYVLTGSRRGFSATQSVPSPTTTGMSWSASETQVWNLVGIGARSVDAPITSGSVTSDVIFFE